MNKHHHVPRVLPGLSHTATLVPRAPQEYLCLVGSPCNTFNCYEDESADKPMPAPTPLRSVGNYIHNPPATTHDLYWANFIDPATRLFANKIARPRYGDIVTLLIYMPGYVARNRVDWQASPYNPIHANSPWVKGNPLYDPYARNRPVPAASPSKQGHKAHSFTPDEMDIHPTEAVINHEILMCTTSENDLEKGIIKRPRSDIEYLDTISSIPRRLVYGPQLAGRVEMGNVLVKVLLCDKAHQVMDYITTGQWNGEEIRDVFLTRDEEDLGGTRYSQEARRNYAYALVTNSGKWERHWKVWGAKPPNVDRKKIKIHRFDYFGHSDDESFFLRYGWSNRKGEVASTDVYIGLNAADFSSIGAETVGLKNHLKPSLFTKDAHAQLWGCFLGLTMGPGLTEYFDEIRASEDRTDFSKILDNDSNMPVPMKTWKDYSHP